jgi:hypothetical protein
MSHLKHVWKIALVGAALTGIFLINATTHRTIQAAAPASVHAVVTPAAVVEMTPIVPAEVAEAARGGNALHSTNRTDW